MPLSLLLTVEATFLISGRGLVVVPGPPVSECQGPGSFPVELRLPGGGRKQAALTLQWVFSTPSPAIARWGCVLTGLGKEDVPLGTEVWWEENARAGS